MKFPIGIQDFKKLREDSYIYVDKTEHIFRILKSGDYYFLSRPRRFGKSLLLSTIKELYAGSRELFEGLWIEDQWDWEHTNPVIHIKFASFKYKDNPLKEAIQEGLAPEAARLGVELAEGDFVNPLEDLIIKAHQKYGRKVALLIDEYDKPIIDYLDEVEKAEENRDTLKWLYSIIKDSDPHLELVFITGVSAFSKVSIFSDLNNLENITLSPSAYTLLGLTQEELERYFPEQLATIDTARMKAWYNGYSWDGEHRLYNPFSILRFLKSGGKYENYWFETGTPTFLVKEMRKHRYYDAEKVEASQHQLIAFDFKNLDPTTILFQTGYLTIQRYVPEDLLYTLDYPNLEVRHSLQQVLLNEYLNYPRQSALPRVVALRNALRQKDIEAVVAIINAAFAEIPGELWKGEMEHFYHAVTHLMFSLLGTYIRSEVRSAKGRCDALVQTDDHIYAFEFKLDGSAEKALQQIREKGYLAPYADSPKEKIAVGVNFSSSERQVVEWKVE